MTTNGESPLNKRHLKALEVLRESTGNVSAVCRAIKINRSTWYEWRNKIPEFADAEEEVREAMIDTVEETLYEMCMSKNITAIIWWTKANARHRGYYESPAVIVPQRTLGDYDPKKDSAEEYIDRALQAAN